jgi:1-acyl-sn-glycerol-3-phosphate acyltransferase
VTGLKNIPDKGPMLIVANHPNTFMDPLIIATLTKQRIGFVANASIFINKLLVSIFSYLHVIPIFRKKDVQPGEKIDNNASFVKCHEYLSKGKTLLIFPEGSSYYELKLREIKTGTARIALSFEELNDFKGNLKILPIALDYSDSLQFRSMVSVTINPPILTEGLKDSFLLNEYECVKNLTEEIRKELAKNIPQTSGKEQEVFLINAHRFYTAFCYPDADLYHNPKRSLEIRKQLSNTLRYAQVHNSELYKSTQTKLNSFYNQLKSEDITSGLFTNEFLKKNKLIVSLGYFFTFIFISPIYLFGLLTNYLPYKIPTKIFNALNIEIEYKTSVAMVAGLFTFPVFYSLDVWVFRTYISSEFWHTILFLFLLPITGYIAMYFWTEVNRFARVIHFYFFMKRRTIIELLKLRDEILNKIEEARKSLR